MLSIFKLTFLSYFQLHSKALQAKQNADEAGGLSVTRKSSSYGVTRLPSNLPTTSCFIVSHILWQIENTLSTFFCMWWSSHAYNYSPFRQSQSEVCNLVAWLLNCVLFHISFGVCHCFSSADRVYFQNVTSLAKIRNEWLNEHGNACEVRNSHPTWSNLQPWQRIPKRS